MSLAEILAELDSEIAALKRARSLLSGIVPAKSVGRPKGSVNKVAAVAAPKKKQKRNLSPEGRARIAAAVKARWARQKKAAKG
jgi:hypothetical protein